jgi:uncharacterized protein (DUF1697 family)
MNRARYALLIRGINVGAKNSLPMAELRAMLEKIGCTEVRTYVQSGNAVFATNLGEAELTKEVEVALERFMGRPIATTLRSQRELASILDGNPFGKVASDPARLCVTFLAVKPTKAEVAPLRDAEFAPELFHVAGKEIYTWHPNGQAKSPLAVALDKLKLRGAVTRRNWNTVQKLCDMLAED